MTGSPPVPPRPVDSLEQYVSGVSSHPPLGEETEADLLARIARGGSDAPAALEALVAGHLRYVVDEALRLRDTGVPLAALIEVGNRGLRNAALRFRAAPDTSFAAYARAWIRRELRGHLDRT